MRQITVVGGGLGGLVAAITAAELGAEVRLNEAHATLGGRSRTSAPPYLANEGPHVVYADGSTWAWLRERGLEAPARPVPSRAGARFRFRYRGSLRAIPPAGLVRMAASRRRLAPVDQDFRSWATEIWGSTAARVAANLAGVVTFDADPGRLSAAFVWERFLRLTGLPPAARYVIGGWGSLVTRLEKRARDLGVSIELSTRVDCVPTSPVIVATSLEAARMLLADDSLHWESGHTALLDLVLEPKTGDPFIVADLDEAGWVECFSLPDPSLVPAGNSLIQAQLPVRPGEPVSAAHERMAALLDVGFPGWRDRLVWQRRSIARGRTGAVDLPGRTWHDRPAIDRGDGVYLVGDKVAAPGLLSEVSVSSAIVAARAAATGRPAGRATISSPST